MEGGVCDHEWDEVVTLGNVREMEYDYVLLSATCSKCGLMTFVDGDITWKPVYWD